MLLFLISPSYRRHFRPRRPTDDVPVGPLLDVIIYWFGGAFGGLFAAMGVMALVTGVAESLAVAMIVASAPLFWIAWRTWWKLNH